MRTPESVRAAARRYRLRHPERDRARKALYYKRNAARCKARYRAWYAKNGEALLARRAAKKGTGRRVIHRAPELPTGMPTGGAGQRRGARA